MSKIDRVDVAEQAKSSPKRKAEQGAFEPRGFVHSSSVPSPAADQTWRREELFDAYLEMKARREEVGEKLIQASSHPLAVMQRQRSEDEIKADVDQVIYELNDEELDAAGTGQLLVRLRGLQDEAIQERYGGLAARITRVLLDIAKVHQGQRPANLDAVLNAAAAVVAGHLVQIEEMSIASLQQQIPQAAQFNEAVSRASQVAARTRTICRDLDSLAGDSFRGLSACLLPLSVVDRNLGLIAYGGPAKFGDIESGVDCVWQALGKHGGLLAEGEPTGRKKDHAVKLAWRRYTPARDAVLEAVEALKQAVLRLTQRKEAVKDDIRLEEDKALLGARIPTVTSNANAQEILRRAVAELTMSTASPFTSIDKGYQEADIQEACRVWKSLGNTAGLRICGNFHVPGWNVFPIEWKERGGYLERTKNLIAGVRESACNVHVHPTGGWRKKK